MKKLVRNLILLRHMQPINISNAYGYLVSKSIAFAYLPMEYAKVGTKLEIEWFGEKVGAEVDQPVLWDAKGERIKA